MKNMNIFYAKILENRVKYFEGKKIIDLSDDEIREFMALRKEISVFIQEKFKPIMENAAEASKLYTEMIKKHSN